MRKRFIKSKIVWGFLLSVFLLAGSALGKGSDKAQGFSLKDIKDMKGSDLELSSFEGKVVLLNVFTTT